MSYTEDIQPPIKQMSPEAVNKKIDIIIDMLKLSGMHGAVKRLEDIQKDILTIKGYEVKAVIVDDVEEDIPVPPAPIVNIPPDDVDDYVPPRYKGKDFIFGDKHEKIFSPTNGIKPIMILYADAFMVEGAKKFPALHRSLKHLIDVVSKIGVSKDEFVQSYSDTQLELYTNELITTGKVEIETLMSKHFDIVCIRCTTIGNLPQDCNRW